MVWMSMCVYDIFYIDVFCLAGIKDIVLVATGINDGPLFCFIAGYYVAAYPHHSNGHLFDKHFCVLFVVITGKRL
jgi:hypothetical protein